MFTKILRISVIIVNTVSWLAFAVVFLIMLARMAKYMKSIKRGVLYLGLIECGNRTHCSVGSQNNAYWACPNCGSDVRAEIPSCYVCGEKRPR